MLLYFFLNLLFGNLQANLEGPSVAAATSLDNIEVVRVLPEISEKPQPPEKVGESVGVKVSARSAIVIDETSGAELFEKNSNKTLPIASLTKLATAYTALEEGIDLDKEFNLVASDFVEGGGLKLNSSDHVVVRDLFYASLVSSANNASEAIVRATGLSREEFINKMNQKVKSLGLENTHFEDVTGLSNKNVSTASEFAFFAREALKNPEIKRATATQKHTFLITNKNREYSVYNTNKLLDSYLDIQGGKTGFTYEAGYCLVIRARDENGNSIIVLTLGSSSASGRFQETKGLATWTFDNYEWQ